MFATLRENAPLEQELADLKAAFTQPVHHELELTVKMHDLPDLLMQFISIDTVYRPPVEWTDPMADMNWLSTGHEVQWTLRDPATGQENMAIHWRFRRGQLVKIRIRNDPQSFHPMQHPIHIHGQPVLGPEQGWCAQRGSCVERHRPGSGAGSTVDLLLDALEPRPMDAPLSHCRAFANRDDDCFHGRVAALMWRPHSALRQHLQFATFSPAGACFVMHAAISRSMPPAVVWYQP